MQRRSRPRALSAYLPSPGLAPSAQRGYSPSSFPSTTVARPRPRRGHAFSDGTSPASVSSSSCTIFCSSPGDRILCSLAPNAPVHDVRLCGDTAVSWLSILFSIVNSLGRATALGHSVCGRPAGGVGVLSLASSGAVLLVPSSTPVMPRPGSCARLRRACVMGRVPSFSPPRPALFFNLLPLSWLAFITLVFPPCLPPPQDAHVKSRHTVPFTASPYLTAHVGLFPHQPATNTIVRDRPFERSRFAGLPLSFPAWLRVYIAPRRPCACSWPHIHHRTRSRACILGHPRRTPPAPSRDINVSFVPCSQHAISILASYESSPEKTSRSNSVSH
ncbi:hypothetical protein BD413DRAFT_181578 [Trametes elegans]|nr:hypothetical protein BD413DRAFT_181578 [Trametes elegans]